MIPVRIVNLSAYVVIIGLESQVVCFDEGLDIVDCQLACYGSYLQLVVEETRHVGVDLESSEGFLDISGWYVEDRGAGEGGIAGDCDGGGGLGQGERGRVVTSQVESDVEGGNSEWTGGAERDPSLGVVCVKFHLFEADLLINPELAGQDLSGIVFVVECDVGIWWIGELNGNGHGAPTQGHRESGGEGDGDGHRGDLHSILTKSTIQHWDTSLFLGQVEGIGSGYNILSSANSKLREGVTQVEEGRVAIKGELCRREADSYISQEAGVIWWIDPDGIGICTCC